MASQLNLSVGRVRVTSATLPSEAGYVRSVRSQMQAIRNNMVQVIQHIERVTPEAIEFGLDPIFEESQRLVPVDTGKLKRSGFIATRRTAGRTQAAIGYGRFGSPRYAAMVHENLIFRHAAPTQAKFLEAAVSKHIGSFRRRVELFMARTMPGLTGGSGG